MQRVDPAIIRQEIERLFAICPELADDEILRADMVNAETSAFELLSQIVRQIGMNEALADAIGNYAKEIAERKVRVERRNHGLRQLAKTIMEYADLTRAELPEATLSVRPGPLKVIITDEEMLPDLLCRLRREPDKARIKELLISGATVQGAVLSNPEPTLTIRVK